MITGQNVKKTVKHKISKEKCQKLIMSKRKKSKIDVKN